MDYLKPDALKTNALVVVIATIIGVAFVTLLGAFRWHSIPLIFVGTLIGNFIGWKLRR